VDASAVGADANADAAADAVDPVCGMDVSVDGAAATVTHDGDTYHFCGEGCADAFESDPERYVEVAAGG
jgi:YHS domain-containing protein